MNHDADSESDTDRDSEPMHFLTLDSESDTDCDSLNGRTFEADSGVWCRLWFTTDALSDADSEVEADCDSEIDAPSSWFWVSTIVILKPTQLFDAPKVDTDSDTEALSTPDSDVEADRDSETDALSTLTRVSHRLHSETDSPLTPTLSWITDWFWLIHLPMPILTLPVWFRNDALSTLTQSRSRLWSGNAPRSWFRD